MFNKIYNWFVKYDTEICWFLTGWFSAYFVVDFSRGNWFGCLINLIIVVANISLHKGRD